jgi:acetolactate synthase I/II/III large subunit
MTFTGAEIIIKLLELQGIEIISGIPGGSNLPLYDALHKSSIRHVLARHEQGATFIAQGMARSTGKPAICFATSGPGATNVVTALADAKLDSIPIIIITGQVSSTLIGTNAFQEIDIISMTKSITKFSFQVSSADELLSIIPEAFVIATSGRPGPVLIDVPKDVQQQKCIVDIWPKNRFNCTKNVSPITTESIAAIAAAIAEAKRPILYIGGGVMQSRKMEHIRILSSKNRIPIVSTLMGHGGISVDDPLYLGMQGMHGSMATNNIMNECDLLLAFGVRFGDRATGQVSHFCSNARIVHINIDPSETGKIIKPDLFVNGDASEVLRSLCVKVNENERKSWINRIAEIKKMYPEYRPHNNGYVHPCNLLDEIGRAAAPDAIITTDVGQHQMWVAQYYPFSGSGLFLTSGGLGTMGFGLPAAIGAALANPERQVICFSGDGSLLMNIQELATLAELQLNVKIVLFNNNQLGLVRQQQDLFYKSNLIASRFMSDLDFVTIARGFGIKGINLSGISGWGEAIMEVLMQDGPAFINIPIHPELQVLPMVPPGAANYEMIGKK